MAYCQSLLLYGSADARDRARALLENLPQVRRVDAKGGQLLLLLHSPITEREYLTLLEKSGVSGFSLCRCRLFYAFSRKGVPSSL